MEMASDTCKILAMPAEILAQILDDCRPDGFESFMMTCKQVYETGYHLITPHRLCKRWRMFTVDFKIEDYKQDTFGPSRPLEFFSRILEAPKRYQPYLPS